MIDLEAIRRRLCDARVMLTRVGLAPVGQDIDALIAEVEKLRAELAQSRADHNGIVRQTWTREV